ncbi:MAG: D-alanine--D-alanine ligase family protein [Candidatus Planktophila sp.]|nr:D-alanine--D-alanine ligase family protein [Candidatus Planktophila sp.]
MKKTAVAIICGGRSSEHEISCLSAGGVLAGLDSDKFEAVLIGITKAGNWVQLPSGYPLAIINGVLPTVDASLTPIVADVHGFSVDGKRLSIDVVFPVLHGPYGEDGTIQGFFETAGISYVGSGVMASAAAMDKSFSKTVFSATGMQVAGGIVVTESDWKVKSSDTSYPVFVKPARGGSSRGTYKVKSEADLEAALADAFTFDRKVMIEQAISGREIECAVLEKDGEVLASVVGEIVIDSKFEFYDFEAKYLDDATTVHVPANIPEAASDEIRANAVQAFKALGCSGLARVDFFYTNKGEVVINEINTMPGFTGTSMYPKLMQATGITYMSLITALISTACARTNGVLGN